MRCLVCARNFNTTRFHRFVTSRNKHAILRHIFDEHRGTIYQKYTVLKISYFLIFYVVVHEWSLRNENFAVIYCIALRAAAVCMTQKILTNHR